MSVFAAFISANLDVSGTNDEQLNDVDVVAVPDERTRNIPVFDESLYATKPEAESWLNLVIVFVAVARTLPMYLRVVSLVFALAVPKNAAAGAVVTTSIAGVPLLL